MRSCARAQQPKYFHGAQPQWMHDYTHIYSVANALLFTPKHGNMSVRASLQMHLPFPAGTTMLMPQHTYTCSLLIVVIFYWPS